MRTVQLRTATGRCVARHVRMACTFQERYVGLLQQSVITEGDGLLLIPGGSIHTLGMRFTIDVVFLTSQLRILGIAERVRPWRIRVAPKGTKRVLELAAGQVEEHRLAVGMYLIVDSVLGDRSEHSTSKPLQPRRELCQREPIQFSLRLPLERRCVRSQPQNPAALSARTLLSRSDEADR